MNSYANLLKSLRKNKRITLRGLEKIINIQNSTISKFENGKLIPNLTHFIKLCEGLKVSYPELKNLLLKYENLIKPSDITHLINLLFPKSKYIIKILAEDTNLYKEVKNMYNIVSPYHKEIIGYSIIALIQHLTSDINKIEKLHYSKAQEFFYGVDLLKKYPNKFFEMSLHPISDNSSTKISILKSCIDYIRNSKNLNANKVIEHINNKYSLNSQEIKILNNILTKKDPSTDLNLIETIAKHNIPENYIFYLCIDDIYSLYNWSLGIALKWNDKLIKIFGISSELAEFIELNLPIMMSNEGVYYSIEIKKLYDKLTLINILYHEPKIAIKKKAEDLIDSLIRIGDLLSIDIDTSLLNSMDSIINTLKTIENKLDNYNELKSQISQLQSELNKLKSKK